MRRIKNHPILPPAAKKTVDFLFEGQRLSGLEGEPIAAALIANGIDVFRTTENNKEPRFLFCGIGQCNDCVVIVDGRANIRSCVTPLKAGMSVERQHGHAKGKER
jgi:predicted molibdopterin-dependent oxidoreductase YjgC